MTTPLSYRTPERATDTRRIFAFYFTLHLIVCGAVTACVFYVLPFFVDFFSTFRTTLPLLTEWLLRAYDFLKDRWFLLPPLVVALPMLAALLHVCWENQPWRRRWLSAALLLIYLSAGLFIVLAVMVPWVQLIRAISGGGP